MSVIQKLLLSLISASEKAACIARACRKEETLFQLLVEEKTGEDKNAKFAQDFKTLADVLIQETLRHYVGKDFPDLRESILGEESNKFTNQLGESVTVEVQETENATMELLKKVLNNNEAAAKLLAEQVHAPPSPPHQAISTWQSGVTPDLKDLAVWIDPIDATSQYIKGGEDGEEGGMATGGLKVVTVLIGVFNKSTGEPIMGVVNQPFGREGEMVHWTALEEGIWHSSPLPTRTPRTKLRVLVGSSESSKLLDRLSQQYEVVKAGGAGYKLLMIYLGEADIYLNTGPSTFQWDTCGPHALLRAKGGGLINCRKGHNITYSVDKGKEANSEGILAFRKEEEDSVRSLLSNIVRYEL